jgi:hypothetical protein
VGATGNASTSAVATGKGRTCGTSGQPSSDDHAGEAGLLATSRQTHTVGHLIVTALSSANLRSCRPRQPILARCHGRIIRCFDHQQHLGSYPSSCWLQRRHRQMDLVVPWNGTRLVVFFVASPSGPASTTMRPSAWWSSQPPSSWCFPWPSNIPDPSTSLM